MSDRPTILEEHSKPSQRLPTMRRAKGGVNPWMLGALVLAIGTGLVWWMLHHSAAESANLVTSGNASAKTASVGSGARRVSGAGRPQPVSVQAVRRQDIRVLVNAIGSIAASNTATVHVQVTGILQKINFIEGQQVKAGQPIAQIDARAFEASLAQAEGALARDRAQLDNANIDLARYRDLLAKDAVPKQQLDTQQALVRQLDGTVKLDQAAVASARLQLSDTRVSAPISGRTGLKLVDLGNLVQPSDPNGIVVVTQTHPIALVFAVPAANVPLIVQRLRTNETMQVHAWDRSGKHQLAVGTVATVDNAIDPSTDTLKVKALFANLDDALFPNQAVSVTLQLDTLKDVLAVPQAAVLRGAQGFYIYVVNADDSVTARPVIPGMVDSDWMNVEGSLQAGEKVVIDGADRLREGAKVEVIQAASTQHSGATLPAEGSGRGGRARTAGMSKLAETGSSASAKQ